MPANSINKKGVELTFSTVIILIIALLVLIFIILFITGGGGNLVTKLKELVEGSVALVPNQTS